MGCIESYLQLTNIIDSIITENQHVHNSEICKSQEPPTCALSIEKDNVDLVKNATTSYTRKQYIDNLACKSQSDMYEEYVIIRFTQQFIVIRDLYLDITYSLDIKNFPHKQFDGLSKFIKYMRCIY